MKYKPVQYDDYLQLGKLLGAQKLRSVEEKRPAHEEHLFIIVHQAYELWFKQIIHDLSSVAEIFNEQKVNESKMNTVVARLERIVEIQKLLIDHISILETMTPLDFLDFRDLLYPASGFQSFQFRVIENLLGLERSNRLTYNNASYEEYFAPDQAKKLKELEKQNSLFTCIEQWLERTPFLNLDGFNFWEEYQKAVKKMFAEEKEIIATNAMIDDDIREKNYKIINDSVALFNALFDPSEYAKLREQGQWRLSHTSVHAALLIQLYRHLPVFHMPFRLITLLLDIDENLTTWRYRHSLMAQRMLGTKVGTGGSSGAKYLRESTEKHKIFTDFFQLTTFFLPKSQLPGLPKELEQEFGFHYERRKK